MRALPGRERGVLVLASVTMAPRAGEGEREPRALLGRALAFSARERPVGVNSDALAPGAGLRCGGSLEGA